MKSIIEQIRDAIAVDGTEVYYPSQHKGECLKEYVVVKSEGTYEQQTVSSERPLYTIMLYVPVNRYGRIESFMFETKQKMKQVFPLVMYAGNETASFYDKDKNAHMVSFQYQGCRKIENR